MQSFKRNACGYRNMEDALAKLVAQKIYNQTNFIIGITVV